MTSCLTEMHGPSLGFPSVCMRVHALITGADTGFCEGGFFIITCMKRAENFSLTTPTFGQPLRFLIVIVIEHEAAIDT